MNQTLIFIPVFIMLLLTMAVWLYLYCRRIPFIQRNQLTPEQLTPGEFAQLAPATVNNPSDNFKNLFEVPMLFYMLALYLFMTQQVDRVYLHAAGIFVLFRILHSVVHCTVNIVKLRFALYFISTLAVWFIAGRAALYYLW